ncbi:MAG: hypothetical protein Q9169_002596 [Polycauliona sp. 2 TL-2023]
MVTLPSQSQTLANMLSATNCVLNFPPRELAPAIIQLMRTTGSREFAATCPERGLRYTRAKFAEAGLTPCRSIDVATAGVEECPMRVEAELVHVCYLPPDESLKAVELRVMRVHADKTIMKVGSPCKVDFDRWQPLQAGSRELCVALNKVGDDDDTRTDDEVSQTTTAYGLRQARLVAKTKASQARYPVIAASPSITSLRARHETAESIDIDGCDETHDDALEANASADSPTDLGRDRLESITLLAQPHAVGLILGCLLFLFCS